MKNIFTFIGNFLNRSGNHIMISSIASRLLSFFASWIALQLIPNKELGIVIYAFQIILFISPMASFGLNQSLIRYGALLKTVEEKNALYLFALIKGVAITILIAILISIISLVLNFKIKITANYLQLLSLALITQYLFELLQIQFRLQKRNRYFAKAQFVYNVLLVLLVFSLSYYYKEFGYAIALIITPLITFFLFFKKLNINFKRKINFKFINLSFWKYGFFASMSNVTTNLLLAIDIILIGYLMVNMEQVTAFKYVSLIPYSLVFLSQVVITTDFVEFTEKIKDKKYIYNYIKNYIFIFSIISVTILIFVFVFGKFFLSLFDPNYINYFSTLITLTIGIMGILSIRGIFGNLLSSIGKASVNFFITSFAVLLNIILNYILIPKYGILGAAMTSSLLMWTTSILCMVFFLYYYKRDFS